MPTSTLISDPLEILDRMTQIVNNDMLTHGLYATDVVNQRLADEGAVCGGHKACAVGSLWIAAGVKVTYRPWGATLPSVGPNARGPFMADKPGLRAAYDALNAAAEERLPRGIEANYLGFDVAEYGGLETLFEGTSIDNAVMLDVIAEAKARLTA